MRGLPIATINDVSTQVYPVLTVVTSAFDLPQDADLAGANYLINQELTFTIDITKMPQPQEVLEKTMFIWDFGDGTQKERIKSTDTITHTYTKMGTKVMHVTADFPAAGFPDIGQQVIQTTVLNVLPTKEYRLPQPIMKINGVVDTQTKSYEANMSYPVTFDGTTSKGTTKIVSYRWDFEDKQQGNGAVTKHSYELPRTYATPLLRVTDANGFFVDEYGTIHNSGSNNPSIFAPEHIWVIFLLGASLIVVTFIVVFIMFRNKRKIHGHR